MNKKPFIAVVICIVFPIFGFGEEDVPDFVQDIRPIFSNKCFVCHGPDANTRQGGFRLDVKASAFGSADSGLFPVVSGKLSESELWQRIRTHDPDEQMPPADSEIELTAAEILLIEKWIEYGAPWEEHWAFQKPRKKKILSVGSPWIRNEIDQFVLEKLQANKKKPSSRANKSTLIRRLSLDLTGLPPTLQETAAFLADDSADAYEKVVDRLLSSPHFGEHFASAWLDAARFADTNGYQNDFKRSMWIWRDWVIESLNQNLPFDQFAIEQIAGDLIPDATMSQKIATGFNRNHRTVTEGGSIEEEWHVENLVDRVETTSTVFLGLTMGCARCHDHKYDPISQKDFYQFFAFFNSINEKGFHNERRGNVPPLLKVPTQDYQSKLDNVENEIIAVEKEIAASLSAEFNDVRNRFQSEPSGDISGDPILVVTGKPNATSLHGRSISFEEKGHQPLELGDAVQFDSDQQFAVSCWVKPDSYGAILSRMDVDDDYRGFDMLINADGTLSVHLVHKWPNDAIKITTKARLKKNQWANVTVSYDASKKAKGISVYFEGERQDLAVNENRLSGSTLTEHPLWLGLRARTDPYIGQIANVRFFDLDLDARDVSVLFKRDLQKIVTKKSWSEEERLAQELKHFLLLDSQPGYKEKVRRKKNLYRRREQIEKNVPTVMVLEEAKSHRPTYVLQRGEYDKPIKSEEIFPGFPDVLHVAPSNERNRFNRMDLAKWLVSDKNPLTSRVTVNRVWSQLFGQGLHKTVEDFGVQSEEPLYLELLDWLSVDFVENGWNLKRLVKQIVTSSTYQQSSSASPEKYSEDPANRWLSRGSRFRLSAEAIRDNALAIGGLLNRKIGGRSVKPYQPDGLWDDLAGGAGEGKYVMERDDNLYRRSLYIYRKRTVPHPTMSTFDASSREICQVARQRTNTPLQALALLNDTTYVEAARGLAVKTMEREGSVEDSLVYMFEKATVRRPNADELAILKKMFETISSKLNGDSNSIEQLLSVGESKYPEHFDLKQLASYTMVGSAILNLDETITRE